ncbi:MAG: GDSL-type esterase/lipase family protein [Ferruginibacter sp.]
MVAGLQFLVKAIQSKQPASQLLIMGILPRRNTEERIVQLNKLIAKIPDGSTIKFADAGDLFLQPGKKIDETLFTDGLHPNAAGYEKLGAFIHHQLIK